MNTGKLVSGIAALAVYLGLIFLVLYFYNIHQTKAKNYVEKNADRVTVTLVNSDKTVLNKKDKVSTPKKPVIEPLPPVVKKRQAKKIVPKRIKVPKKRVPKKTVPKKVKVPKKRIPKNVVPKKVVPKKIAPKKKIPKKVVPKKKVPKKEIPKKVVPKKKVPKKKVPKRTAQDLFSSVKTKDVKKRPIKERPVKRVVKRPVKEVSRIKHNSSATDRILATHQSGRVSNANRDKGIENAYIAKVKRHMKNWKNVGARGRSVTVELTILQSGKFRYKIYGVSGGMKNSLKQYLDSLNRIGLGRHKKSTPYSIKTQFRAN